MECTTYIKKCKRADIIIYKQGENEIFHSVQVKTLSKRNAVSLGSKLENLSSEYWIICRGIEDDHELFLMNLSGVKKHGELKKDNYWLQYKYYEEYRVQDIEINE